MERRRKKKYILLNNDGVTYTRGFNSFATVMNMWFRIRNEVRRGELLEAVPEPQQPLQFGRIALVGIESKDLHLECRMEDIFELSDEDVGLLMAIRSSELRYETFINKLQNVWQRLSLGSVVSVSLSASSESVLGVVRYMGELSSQSGTWFGVELMRNPRYPSQGSCDGSYGKTRYFTCAPDSGVFVSLDKLTPRKHAAIFINQRVVTRIEDCPARGTVRYIGEEKYSQNNVRTIVGLEMDEKLGTGNGRKNGFQYFVCRKDFAVFVPIETVIPEKDFHDSHNEAFTNAASKKPDLVAKQIGGEDGLYATSLSCVNHQSGGEFIREAKRTSSIDSADSQLILAAVESSKVDLEEFIEKQRQMLDEFNSSKVSGLKDGNVMWEDDRAASTATKLESQADPFENTRKKYVKNRPGSSDMDLWAKGKQIELQEMENRFTCMQEQLRGKEKDADSINRQLQVKEEQTSNLQRQLMRTQQLLREKNEREENLQRRMRARERQVAHFQAQMREKESEEVSLNGQLRGKDHQIENLQRRLNEKEQHLTNLQRQLLEKDLLEASLHEQLARKEQQVANSEVQLRGLNQQLTDVQGQIRENNDETAAFRERLGVTLQRVGTLEEQLRTKDQAVTELQLTLSTAQQALNEYQCQQSPDWVISRDQVQLTDKILGRGGWGSVAEGKYCGCAVAVKQIHELILSPYNRSLFEREMNIASKCRHPCLLQFIGATNDEGSPLFVTELMESSLRSLLEQRSLSTTEVSIISLDVARALNYLHQKQPSPIIHRDVSSANVLLWRQGNQWRGKVSDYGTANFMQQTMTVSPGAMIYSAPEALTSNQTVKVDVYSFGVLLCEMCIRELPDHQKRDQQVARVKNNVIRALIRGCLQPEAEARPSMEEITSELEQPV